MKWSIGLSRVRPPRHSYSLPPIFLVNKPFPPKIDLGTNYQQKILLVRNLLAMSRPANDGMSSNTLCRSMSKSKCREIICREIISPSAGSSLSCPAGKALACPPLNYDTKNIRRIGPVGGFAQGHSQTWLRAGRRNGLRLGLPQIGKGAIVKQIDRLRGRNSTRPMAIKSWHAARRPIFRSGIISAQGWPRSFKVRFSLTWITRRTTSAVSRCS